MEVYERIRFLRKDTLKMSQTAFGERLGVNRDVINNIDKHLTYSVFVSVNYRKHFRFFIGHGYIFDLRPFSVNQGSLP